MYKRKILIGFIVILIAFVFVLVCLAMINYSKQEIIIESDFGIAEVPEETTISENEVLDIPAEENIILGNAEIQEPTETKVDTTSQEKVSSEAKKQSNSTQAQLQAKQETAQSKKQIQSKTETTQSTQTQGQIEQPKVTEEKKETITTPSGQNTTTVAKDEEKYVRNDAMINKIKQVIESNESEYMKQYGYNIVVDSSIKNQANQFTFTATRVKAYIKYCFGTIKVYAEDYYKNGQLIMTECYLY